MTRARPAGAAIEFFAEGRPLTADPTIPFAATRSSGPEASHGQFVPDAIAGSAVRRQTKRVVC
jgi:hypothetical protein